MKRFLILNKVWEKQTFLSFFFFYFFSFGLAQNESLPESTFKIPVKIPKEVLSKIINKQTEGIIFQTDHVEGANGTDFSVRILKVGPIQLEGKEDKLISHSPLRILVKGVYRTKVLGAIVSKNLDEELFLKVSLSSQFSIDYQWRLKTKTELIHYEWLKTPSINFGIFKIPVNSLIDKVIEDEKQNIAQQIDNEILNKFDLRSQIQDAWKIFQIPFPVFEWGKEKAWVTFKPQRLGLTKLKFEEDNLISYVNIAVISSAEFSETTETEKMKDLPSPFFQELSGNEVKMNIPGKVEREIANQKLKEVLGKETYSFRKGKYKIKVQEVDVSSKGERLLIRLQTEGSVSGDVMMWAKPVYNPKTGLIDMENFDYELDAKVKMSKFVRWLFAKKIKNQIKIALEENFNQQIKDLREQIEKSLKEYAINQNTILKGLVEDFHFQDIQLKDGYFHALIILKGNFEVFINGFE